MEVVRLVAQRRSRTGKGASRQLRREGRLPVVLYGHGTSEVLAVGCKDLVRIRQSEAGANVIMEVVIEGDPPTTTNAILREVQMDPVSQAPLHADLYRVVMDEPIKVTVPLEFIKVPEERLKGAQVMLAPSLREVEVECLPQDIPEVVTVDLAALEIGAVIRAGALRLPQGVTLLNDPEEPVVTTEMLREEMGEEASREEGVPGVTGGGTERTAGGETPAG